MISLMIVAFLVTVLKTQMTSGQHACSQPFLSNAHELFTVSYTMNRRKIFLLDQMTLELKEGGTDFLSLLHPDCKKKWKEARVQLWLREVPRTKQSETSLTNEGLQQPAGTNRRPTPVIGTNESPPAAWREVKQEFPYKFIMRYFSPSYKIQPCSVYQVKLAAQLDSESAETQVIEFGPYTVLPPEKLVPRLAHIKGPQDLAHISEITAQGLTASWRDLCGQALVIGTEMVDANRMEQEEAASFPQEDTVDTYESKAHLLGLDHVREGSTFVPLEACKEYKVYFDVYLTEDNNRPNETYEFSSVVTKADNRTFGNVRLDSNLVRWDLKYYHKTTFPCADSIGYSLLVKDGKTGQIHILKEEKATFHGWIAPYNISQANVSLTPCWAHQLQLVASYWSAENPAADQLILLDEAVVANSFGSLAPEPSSRLKVSAKGEVALSLHGCNASHSLHLLIHNKTGLQPIVFPLETRENGTGISHELRQLAQACLNFTLQLDNDPPTDDELIQANLRLPPTGIPRLIAEPNGTLANTDLRIEDNPANANCQPKTYQFQCTPLERLQNPVPPPDVNATTAQPEVWQNLTSKSKSEKFSSKAFGALIGVRYRCKARVEYYDKFEDNQTFSPWSLEMDIPVQEPLTGRSPRMLGPKLSQEANLAANQTAVLIGPVVAGLLLLLLVMCGFLIFWRRSQRRAAAAITPKSLFITERRVGAEVPEPDLTAKQVIPPTIQVTEADGTVTICDTMEMDNKEEIEGQGDLELEEQAAKEQAELIDIEFPEHV